MPDHKFSYTAQRFLPRGDEQPPLLLFVAPAGDIREWAGVPRKAFDYLHGFQRTLQPERIRDVARYFREDERNVSPTAVVVGLGPSVAITPAASANEAQSPRVEVVEVCITLPDYESTPITELAERALVELERRLAEEAVSAIRERTEEAILAAARFEDEDTLDQDLPGEAESEIRQVDRSYLEEFYAQLLGYVRRTRPWPEDERLLREVLYSLVKPAIIVDGQHRVFGAAETDESMLLAICGVPNSNWAENVYQFVVINQKAKPIKPAFLSSIIATSLSEGELREVYHRLKASRVDVERSATMERVNTEPLSPFRGMIDFEVQGDPGFLSFPGMWRLAADFANVENTHAVLLPGRSWDGVEGTWIDHFFGFWNGIRDYFSGQDERLWKQPTESNPNSLLKIVALQEVQGFLLDLWADSRLFTFSTPEQMRERARGFWDGFPPTFFSDEWKLKGLQTQVGRGILRQAIQETRRNHGQRNWGHRRLQLFRSTGP